MNSSYKKVIGPHIFQLLLTFSLIRTMFCECYYHYYQTKTYNYSYFYGYRISIPSYKNNFDYYNFYETITYDGGTGTLGALIFLFVFLSIVLSIVALATKKSPSFSLVALIIPFSIAFWFSACMIYIQECTYFNLDEGSAFMFIALGLMIINSIVGLIIFSKKQSQNKAMAAQAQAIADNSLPASDWNPNGSVQTSATPMQKPCPHCGNACVSQAVICVRCGSNF